MTSDYEFEMPWPPSVNVWKTPFKNRMILTKKGRDYRQRVICRMHDLKLQGENITKPMHVSLVLNPPTLRRYDIDNFTKSLFDALTHSSFWGDDELVHKLTIVKGEKSPPGNVQVKVTIL